MTLTELLAQYDVDEQELTEELGVRLRTRPRSGAADLTAAEESFWDKHAGLSLSVDAAASSVSDEVGAMADQLATSLTIEQAATLLGVDRTRVSHRIRQQELYAFRLGRQQRLPRWQFQVSGTTALGLPGLARVLDVLPDGLHPLSVEGFFTTPDPDLGGSSPLHWLAEGGDPAVVAQEAATLDRW